MAGINTGVWSPWLQPWGGGGQWGSPAPFDMTVGQPNVLGGGMFGGGGPAAWGNLLPAFGGGFGGGWNGSPNGQVSTLGVGMNWDGVNNPQLSANAGWTQWQNTAGGGNGLGGGIGLILALFAGIVLGRRNSGGDSDSEAMASNSDASRSRHSGSTPIVGDAHSSESERTYYGPRYTKATGRGVPTGQTEREEWVHPQNSQTRTV